LHHDLFNSLIPSHPVIVLLLTPWARSAAFLGQIGYNMPQRAVLLVVSKSRTKDGNGIAMHIGPLTPDAFPERLRVEPPRYFDTRIPLFAAGLRRASAPSFTRPGKPGRLMRLLGSLDAHALG
jgi:hypothetical protein